MCWCYWSQTSQFITDLLEPSYIFVYASLPLSLSLPLSVLMYYLCIAVCPWPKYVCMCLCLWCVCVPAALCVCFCGFVRPVIFRPSLRLWLERSWLCACGRALVCACVRVSVCVCLCVSSSPFARTWLLCWWRRRINNLGPSLNGGVRKTDISESEITFERHSLAAKIKWNTNRRLKG